jgi:hypothetical protein
MNKKSILLLGVVLTISLLAIACKKTLTGKEATEALDIESQTPDIGSLQYVVTIKNKTSNNVKGRVRVICDIYPKTRGDVRVLGEVNGIAEDFWAPNSSKRFTFPIKRNYPITSDFELHAHLENP